MLLFPKPAKRVKVPKPLRRSKKRIASKSTFKAFDNGKRCRRLTDAQVLAYAREKQLERLNNPTEAETELCAILTRLGVVHERERIFQNGDRFVIVDVFVPSVNLCLEADGAQHRLNKRYDHGRSLWLARQFGVKVCRFWNKQITSGAAEQRIREMLGMQSTPSSSHAM